MNLKNKVEISAENFQKQLAITNLIDNHIKKIDEDTGGYSSHAPTLRHISFLELVAMGDRIVNYLFYLMFESGSSWTILLLLDKVVKDKPEIPNEHAGSYRHIVVDWMKWYLTSDYYKNDDLYFNLV
jgi:hypothetical protein